MLALWLTGCNSLSTLLFYPDTHYYRTPDNLNINYQTVTLTSDDGAQLRNWVLSPKQTPKATILFLHGNGENISTHMGSIAWITEHGYEVFMMDYRGYGRSTGVPTLENTFADIEMVHQWVSTQRSWPLVLFGQSMGGALALTYNAHLESAMEKGDHLGSLRSFSSMVAESSPASWPQIAREVMRQNWVTWPLQLPASLIPGEYDAQDHIASVTRTPLLLMHSRDDDVVPFHHAEQLLTAAQRELPFIEASGRHIAAMAHEEVRNQVLGFIEENQ